MVCLTARQPVSGSEPVTKGRPYRPALVRRRSTTRAMIDYFALALTHGLLLIGLLRVLTDDTLDHEDVATLAETDAAEAARGEGAEEGAKKRGPKKHRPAHRNHKTQQTAR